MATTIEIGFHDYAYHELDHHDAYASSGEAAQILSKRVKAGAAEIKGVISSAIYGGFQIKTSNFGHTVCDGGAPFHEEENGYHNHSFHNGRFCAGIGAEIDIQRVGVFAAQVRAAIYNTDNLRIMCSFPTRGDGTSWTASSTEASTTNSFIADNLNTDVVEQIWRSASGVKTGITLDCDAGAGVTIFMDTFAILNHNMTTSAVVSLIGSDNAGHAPPGDTISLTMTENNFIYIADELPNTGYRYWRLSIDDSTNSNDHISIGTVVGGASTIFNNECFIDRVVKTPRNFSDTVFTEAFTNVQNDRGVKNRVKLDFRNIRYNGANWAKLNDEVFDEARTILKCLWVPTPEFPLRFFTFAKMVKMPVENHNVKGENLDFIDFTIETDESL